MKNVLRSVFMWVHSSVHLNLEELLRKIQINFIFKYPGFWILGKSEHSLRHCWHSRGDALGSQLWETIEILNNPHLWFFIHSSTDKHFTIQIILICWQYSSSYSNLNHLTHRDRVEISSLIWNSRHMWHYPVLFSGDAGDLIRRNNSDVSFL